MNQWVMVPIPVSPEAAERLGEDEERRQTIGQMVTRLLMPETGFADPIEQFLNSIPRDADLPELTEAEIQAEIDAVRAAHRR